MQPKTKTKRPLVFIGVGILNTLLDFAFYTLLTQTFFRGAESIAIAGILSGTFALVCAFTTHSLITWKGRQRDKATVLRFVLFTGFGMWVIRPILLALFISLTPLYELALGLSTALSLPFTYEFIANTGAFGFMAILILIYNYWVYDRFVFKPNGQPPETKNVT